MNEMPHEKMPEWFSDIEPDMREGVRRVVLESRRNAVVECDALIAAGWRYELPEIVNGHGNETEPWQWYWRRPPRRKGSKGMRFLSTTMAYNAMMRERNRPRIFKTAS